MRKINDTRVGEDMEQLYYSYTAGRTVNCYNHFEKLWQTISAKAKHICVPCLSNSTSRYTPKVNECIRLPKNRNKNAHSKA